MKQLTRPDFCTPVFPDEYNYVAQFDEAIKAANKFHRKINKECPPPYYPIDMGKLYGLVMEIQKLKEELEKR